MRDDDDDNDDVDEIKIYFLMLCNVELESLMRFFRHAL